ncbi:NAD(P)/FAD-dependent oxidoreductase [Hahella sp. NBU794]|uniref:NAD(P)/FAD-dependent oxidoreductase n=1 Tax=Hahella sp. NBU794 TaxID=3422590 RepID=UPI003D6EAFEB
MMSTTNRHFDVIVIGAGILGCASADYLSAQGQKVLLLDRRAPASATTSQAAALLGRARGDATGLDMVDETWRAIERLQTNLKEDLDVRACGSLHAGVSAAASAKIHALADETTKRHRAARYLDTHDLQARLPWLQAPRDAVAVFVAEDGYIDPYQLASAYLRHARRCGARLQLNAEVAEILTGSQGVCGVRCADGVSYYSRQIVVTGGPWSALLLRPLGLAPAMAPVRSQYWISAPDAHIQADTPVLVLPDANAYARPEVGGLLFGLRDRQRVNCSPEQLPEDIHRFSFDQDSDGLASLEDGYESLQRWLPMLDELRVAAYVSGVSSYTPDGRFLIGALEIPGLWLASGCCGGGVGASGGYGRLIAELVSGVRPFTNASLYDPNRFDAHDVNPFDPAFRLRCALAREGKVSG